MTWLSDSIMATRGLAGNKTGSTHQLGEAEQGEYHFTMGPYSEPVLRVAPGDRIVVETRDAFGGAIKTEQDLPVAETPDAIRESSKRSHHDRRGGAG